MPKLLKFDQLIEIFNVKHKHKYDYSESKYFGINKKICIICPDHGRFYQTPDSHKYYGCTICGIDKRYEYYKSCSKKYNSIEIQNKIAELGSQYCCSLLQNKIYNSIEIVDINCNIHNISNKYSIREIFKRKSFCDQCKYINRIITSSKPKYIMRMAFSEFLAKLESVFPIGFYEFKRLSEAGFSLKENIQVTCLRHNQIIIRKAQNILNNKCACYICNKSISAPEREIWIKLQEMGILFEFQKVFEGLKIGPKKYLKVDFYIPKFNLVIEYDGEQHFRPLKRGHDITDEEAIHNFRKLQKNDNIKEQYFHDNAINIERIHYLQKNIKQVIETIIHKYER